MHAYHVAAAIRWVQKNDTDTDFIINWCDAPIFRFWHIWRIQAFITIQFNWKWMIHMLCETHHTAALERLYRLIPPQIRIPYTINKWSGQYETIFGHTNLQSIYSEMLIQNANKYMSLNIWKPRFEQFYIYFFLPFSRAIVHLIQLVAHRIKHFSVASMCTSTCIWKKKLEIYRSLTVSKCDAKRKIAIEQRHQE